MTFPYGQPIILRQRIKNGTDTFGNEVWSTVDSTVRGSFNPGASMELLQGQDVLTTQPTVYIPADSVLSALDAVIVDGLVYEVDGAPSKWGSPLTGWQAGIEVKLRRVTG